MFKAAKFALAGAFAASALIAGTVSAQEEMSANQGAPEGWMTRADHANHGGGDSQFMVMEPGFHITQGASGIYYHPEMTENGEFRAETEIALFDPGQRNEGFGLIFGGSDLQGEDQAYSYFLIRRDGNFLVKRRDGAETETLQGWTPNDAIATWDGRDEGAQTVTNVLAVESSGGELVFSVNGTEVHRMSSSDQHVDGIVGLRVNHGLNIHVTRVDVIDL